MDNKKNIVLIGFMGCGKTTVGIKLSWKIKLPVDDTDKLIERRLRKSISQVFADEGEAFFREQETLLLANMKEKKQRRIISVGGGTPVRAENRKLLKELGTVVYLRIRPESVYERVKGDTGRPLLQCDNPLEKITALMAERAGAYEDCADFVLDVDEMDLDGIVSAIMDAVGGF